MDIYSTVANMMYLEKTEGAGAAGMCSTIWCMRSVIAVCGEGVLGADERLLDVGSREKLPGDVSWFGLDVWGAAPLMRIWVRKLVLIHVRCRVYDMLKPSATSITRTKKPGDLERGILEYPD